MKALRVGALFVLPCVGCGSELDNLRTRAAFDFQCRESELEIVNLDDEGRSYGVTGCKQRAVYLYRCDGTMGADCTWIRNK